MASKAAVAAVLKADLMEHQLRVCELLEDVINDGKTITITHDEKPVAVMLPYDEFLDLTASHRLVVEHGKLGDR